MSTLATAPRDTMRPRVALTKWNKLFHTFTSCHGIIPWPWYNILTSYLSIHTLISYSGIISWHHTLLPDLVIKPWHQIGIKPWYPVEALPPTSRQQWQQAVQRRQSGAMSFLPELATLLLRCFLIEKIFAECWYLWYAGCCRLEIFHTFVFSFELTTQVLILEETNDHEAS